MRISVIIPAFNARNELALSLKSLAHSVFRPHECIVVDDGSTDDSAVVAGALNATVIRLSHQAGPAAARNAGAAIATGDILFFVDADVCVQPDTLQRIDCSFEADPSLSALIGSYDDTPFEKDFLSQYRNLMHHFVHQTGREEASTFWSGCGAIRTSAFRDVSGFDESYTRPAIEDIELGYRLKLRSHKLVLDHDLTVKHLKRWTFMGLVRSDIFNRGIPWTELILRDRRMPNDLNLALSQRVSVALAFVLVIVTAAAAVYWRGYILTPLLALMFFVLARFWVEAASPTRPKSAPFLLVAVALAIAALAQWHHMPGLIPPLVLSQLLLFSGHRYSATTSRARRWLRLPVLIYVLLSVFACLYYIPSHGLMLLVLLVAVAMGLLNSQFYLFLASARGVFFAIAAVPFHMLYHFYNGLSFVAGTLRYWSRRARPAPLAVSQPAEHPPDLVAKL